ncbi:MAG: hypothetical protein COU46_03380 [Candidatus Niyogibacteria bacterium CG10_big_fil_rev_8_21_14_0_10_42_19]|uniref:DUF5671 domain-containing protein n=1 Tax=Candidatus Niyogibacteria bacterium CG10_big_fil_rev_8_21_14_0_10_42_19 TaxID=1974725 RepID=A0A2H0TEW4_9BACT|nr:MAG: hypothetical protein COU46_03380 [Candidatus Niyogibacteria bacterium CG10_big_fil_rev_8_21_14_0_10_42_19]
MKTNSWIRMIYLYTFAMLGLVLLTIGGVRFLDMGLKVYVFTKAEEQERIMYKQPAYAPFSVERIQEIEKGEAELTAQEHESLKRWLIEQENWERRNEEINPVTAQRHRNASFNLALILIGMPLYFYHWRVIKKDNEHA